MKHESKKKKRKNGGEGGLVGRKKKERQGKKRTETDWGGRRERLRNNIHKSVNMCLSHEQPIGSIYFVFFRMAVVRG